jgi:hypothetical protein
VPVSGDTVMTYRHKNPRWRPSNALPKVIRPEEFPVCPICNRHVVLETAKVDESGRATHEECYVMKIRLRQEKSA